MDDEELGYRRGFGRYLDKDMAEQAHTAAEADCVNLFRPRVTAWFGPGLTGGWAASICRVWR